jgi:hypothetical protein
MFNDLYLAPRVFYFIEQMDGEEEILVFIVIFTYYHVLTLK